MGAIRVAPASALPVSLAELKAYARISASDEEALLAAMMRSATDLCERFTGRLLIARAIEETLPAARTWTRLTMGPVRSIDGVVALDRDGNETPLPSDAYAVDVDAAGDGWVRLVAPGDAKRVRVSYVAGLGEVGNAVPEALRHGILRLAAHFHARAGSAGDDSFPAAVTALWRPWRRLGLGGGAAACSSS